MVVVVSMVVVFNMLVALLVDCANVVVFKVLVGAFVVVVGIVVLSTFMGLLVEVDVALTVLVMVVDRVVEIVVFSELVVIEFVWLSVLVPSVPLKEFEDTTPLSIITTSSTTATVETENIQFC